VALAVVGSVVGSATRQAPRKARKVRRKAPREDPESLELSDADDVQEHLFEIANDVVNTANDKYFYKSAREAAEEATQREAADVAQGTAVPDSVLERFHRLEDKTQELALRQLRNPGMKSSPRDPKLKKASKRVGLSANGPNAAIPFDFSNGGRKKKKARPYQEPRTLEELTSSNPSFELDLQLHATDNLQSYLKDIGRHPLLTPEEEIMLGQTIEDGVKAKAALKAKDYGQCTKKELVWISQQGDSAYSTFVLSNLRLVVWTAKKYFTPEGITLLDMIQDGNIGLIKSVEKWDWRKGNRFSTYSTWWIRQSIDKGLAFARQIRLPEHMRLQVQRVKKQASLLFTELGRNPTDMEMAARMEMSVEKYREVAQLSDDSLLSLDAAVGKGSKAHKSDGESTNLMDFIRTEEKYTPDSELMATSLEDDLKQVVMTTCTERQALVLTKRFGLDGGDPYTLQGIGDILGVTRERVRQLEIQGMKRLKTDSRSKESLANLYKQMLDVEHAAC
jgi:RNA polymerase sigma factor (sigma-70 family)